VVRDLLRRSSALWFGIGVHKVGVLVFSFGLGKAMGARAVGVMAAVLASSWLVGTLAGLGLTDRILFVMAREDTPAIDERTVHGSYIGLVMLAHALLFFGAPMLGGVDDPQLSWLARGLVVGAGLQALAAYPFCARRGLGHTRHESLGLVVAGAVLVAASQGPMTVMAFGWAAAGGIQALFGAIATRATPRLWPRWATPSAHTLRAGLPWLGFGVGAWLIGNADILLARLIAPPADMGELQVGTMVVRAGGMAPWVIATLSLRHLETRWRASEGMAWTPLIAAGVTLSLSITTLSFIATPLLATGHGLPMTGITVPMWTSIACAPLTVSALLILPIAAARDRGRTLVFIGAGLIAAALTAWLRPLGLGVSDSIIAAGAAQLVVVLGLLPALRGRP
jgi:hypothetical protein